MTTEHILIKLIDFAFKAILDLQKKLNRNYKKFPVPPYLLPLCDNLQMNI